jgi:hypothetical protein
MPISVRPAAQSDDQRIRQLNVLADPAPVSKRPRCVSSAVFPPFAAAADGLDAGDPIDTDSAVHRWFRPTEIAARPAFVDDIATQLMGAIDGHWQPRCAALPRSTRSPQLAISLVRR